MELATLFSVAYHYEVPIGSVMLVSDMPLQKRGIKDKKMQDDIFSNHMETHLDIAIDVIENLNSRWDKIERELTSEW
jgi:AMP nucleosidase